MKNPLQSPKCPNCNHLVKWTRVYFRSGIWVQWPCPECGRKLEFSYRHRLLYMIPLYAMIFGTAYALRYYNISIWWIFLLVIITPVLYYMERVKLAKNIREPEL